MNATVYPTESDVTFILCDEVRQEVHGKLSLMGVYAGGDVLLEKDLASTSLRLSFYWAFESGLGPYDWQMIVTAPSGSRFFETPVGQTENTLDGQIVLVVVFIHTGFEQGTYKVTVRLNGREYTRHIRVKKSKIPA